MSPPTTGSGTQQGAISATNTQTLANSQTGTESETRLVLIGSEDASNIPTTEREPRVSWAEDTIDNEHMNRKKSKICCIYHPPEEFGESEEESEVSSSSSSSSSSESESGSDSAGNPCCSTKHQKHKHKYRPNAYERPAKPRKTQAN